MRCRNRAGLNLVSGMRPRPEPVATPPSPQGTPADVLYKGTITRIIGEDSPSRLDRGREDGLPKGHVIYEGKKGHVLSYEGEFLQGAGRRAGRGGQGWSGPPGLRGLGSPGRALEGRGPLGT